MNFLSICQRTHDIVGFQGQFTSVQATGFEAVLVTAVQDTYQDVQRYRTEWDWLRQTRQINVSDVKTVYTLDELWGADTPDLASYLYINWTSARRIQRLRQIHYDDFQFLVDPQPGDPRAWTYDLQTMNLEITPVDQVFTLDLYYTKSLDALLNNIDVPLIPDRHHQILVYGACMKLSTFVGNPTLYDTYAIKYAEELAQLMRESNPVKRVTKQPVA